MAFHAAHFFQYAFSFVRRSYLGGFRLELILENSGYKYFLSKSGEIHRSEAAAAESCTGNLLYLANWDALLGVFLTFLLERKQEEKP